MFINGSFEKKNNNNHTQANEKPAFQQSITSRLQLSRQTKNNTTACVIIEHNILGY